MTRPSAKVIPIKPVGADDRDAALDRAKGAFKLDLIETANADPLLDGSDLKLLIAYASIMSWPKREAWLAISLARAKTGLSERQVIASRWRLAGIAKREKDKGKPFRVYLRSVCKVGVTTIYAVDNPWSQDARDHVRDATDYHRDQTRQRQSDRRRKARVHAKNAETNEGMSQRLGECDNTAKNAGNIPSYTPQYLALKEGTPSQGYAVATDDDPDCPFPIPADASEAETMLTDIIGGRTVSEIGRQILRNQLERGALSPAAVEQWRAVHDGRAA